MSDTTAIATQAPTTNLQELRNTHEALRLRLEAAEMQNALTLLESSALPGRPLREAWGDLIDPLEWTNDEQGFGRPWRTYGATLGDRRDGRNAPVFETETDLAAIRAVSRVLANSSPNAKCALRNLTNYIIGTGFNYAATPRETDNEVSADLVATVQAIIDQFVEDNKWKPRRERETFSRSRRDGEVFLALFHVGGGRVRVRFVEPEQIIDPGIVPQYGQNWAFGVVTDAEDIETVRGYWVKWNEIDQPEFVPTDRMLHIKIGTDTNIKRGLSDFYAVYSYLEDAAKLIRNTVKGAAIMAAIAYIRKHAPGTTESQVQSFQSGNAYRKYTQNTATEGSRTRYVNKIEPGTIVDAGPGMDYEASPLANQGVGAACVTIEQAVLRVIGCNWCMPEYLISGDASNANYSSTMVAESPWVKNCEAEQAYYMGDFQDLLWKVVAIAYEAGRFARFDQTLGAIKRLITIDITPPDVAVRDRDKETVRRKMLREEGIISDETFAAEEGYDLEVERSQGAQRQQPSGFGAAGFDGGVPESRQQRYALARDLLFEGYP